MLVSRTPTQSCLSHCISGSLSSICESEGSSPWEQREARGGCTQCVQCSGVPEGRGEKLWGWGRGPHKDSSCRAGAGVLMKILKHLSSEVRKTCPETNLESLPLSQVCKLSQQGMPAQPPPHPWHICSHQQPHEASLTQRLPSFPSQKMTTPISGISTLPIDSLGE